MMAILRAVWQYVVDIFSGVFIVCGVALSALWNVVEANARANPKMGPLVTAVMVFVVLDTVCGVLRAIRECRLSSYRFSAVIFKLLAYSIVFIATVILDGLIGGSLVTSTLAFAIIIRELMSILEHTKEFVPGQRLRRLLQGVLEDVEHDESSNADVVGRLAQRIWGVRPVIHDADSNVCRDARDGSENDEAAQDPGVSEN